MQTPPPNWMGNFAMRFAGLPPCKMEQANEVEPITAGDVGTGLASRARCRGTCAVALSKHAWRRRVVAPRLAGGFFPPPFFRALYISPVFASSLSLLAGHPG
jgi:hypothetical protein